MEKITGKNNQLIKDTKKLFSSSKERRLQGSFVLEGARLCFDVLHSFYQPEILLITENIINKYPNEVRQLSLKCAKSFLITPELAQKLSDTENTQGIFCICRMKEGQELSVGSSAKLLALDCIQDPGNLGAIARTGEALGIDGIIIGAGCDIYNPKALRSSMGSILRMNMVQTDDLAELLLRLKKDRFQIYAASPDRQAEHITQVKFSRPCVCVIGNEANGVSSSVKELAHGILTIPMRGDSESLNASVAAAIIMWEMMR